MWECFFYLLGFTTKGLKLGTVPHRVIIMFLSLISVIADSHRSQIHHQPIQRTFDCLIRHIFAAAFTSDSNTGTTIGSTLTILDILTFSLSYQRNLNYLGISQLWYSLTSKSSDSKYFLKQCQFEVRSWLEMQLVVYLASCGELSLVFSYPVILIIESVAMKTRTLKRRRF